MGSVPSGPGSAALFLIALAWGAADRRAGRVRWLGGAGAVVVYRRCGRLGGAGFRSAVLGAPAFGGAALLGVSGVPGASVGVGCCGPRFRSGPPPLWLLYKTWGRVTPGGSRGAGLGPHPVLSRRGVCLCPRLWSNLLGMERCGYMSPPCVVKPCLQP